MDHGWHKLSENMLFVGSKRSNSGDKRGCDACGRTDGQRTTECEDRARILETEFAIVTKLFNDLFFLLECPRNGLK